jgi:hypothetical protein
MRSKSNELQPYSSSLEQQDSDAPWSLCYAGSSRIPKGNSSQACSTWPTPLEATNTTISISCLQL